MRSIDLHDTPFNGTTSRPASSLAMPSSCSRCGSSLGGRKRQTRFATVGKTRFAIREWLCGCGKRTVRKQEVGAR